MDSKKENTAKHIENQGEDQTEGKSNKLEYLDKRRSEKILWKDDNKISPYRKTA